MFTHACFTEGNGKVHEEAPRRNQRVALEDRTNLGTDQVEIEVKPGVQITRPITRSFHAQLLAKAQKNNGVITLSPLTTADQICNEFLVL